MTTVDITPNFSNMRNTFERQATLVANNIARRMKTEGEIDSSDVRSLIVYLNIALQAVDTAGALIEFREAFSTFAHAISEANDEANTVAIKDIVID
jgi:hypothetical protein